MYRHFVAWSSGRGRGKRRTVSSVRAGPHTASSSESVCARATSGSAAAEAVAADDVEDDVDDGHDDLQAAR